LIGACAPFFLRSFDKPIFPLSFLVFPVIFNFNMMMGFYSYSIAVPLFITALSISWRIRYSSIYYRFIAINFMGLLLYFFHLIPFIFYLLSLGVKPLIDGKGYKEIAIGFIKNFILINPLILLLCLYLSQGSSSSLHNYSYLLSLPRFLKLFLELLVFSTVSFSPWQVLPSAILIIVFYLLIRGNIIHWGKTGPLSVPDKYILCITTILILIYFVAPFRFGDGSYFNERFPWVILLLSLPLAKFLDTSIYKHMNTIVVLVPCIFFVFNSATLWQQSNKINEFVGGLHIELPKGAFVMTYKGKTAEKSSVDVLLHAVSYYCISKKYVNVGNYETEFIYFPIHFSNSLPPFPSPGVIAFTPSTINWALFPSIEYIFGWNTDEADKAILSSFFQIVWKEGLLSIWKRKS